MSLPISSTTLMPQYKVGRRTFSGSLRQVHLPLNGERLDFSFFTSSLG